MTLISQSFTATGAPDTTDLLLNSVHRLAPVDREVTGAGLQASNTQLYVDLFASDVLIGRFHGQTAVTGVQTTFPVDALVPQGAELRAIVGGQPGTAIGGIIYIQIDDVVDEIPMELAGMI